MSIPSEIIQLKDAVLQGYTPPVGGQFYPLKLLRSIGGYSPNIKSGIDHDIWIRLAILNVVVVPIKKAFGL